MIHEKNPVYDKMQFNDDDIVITGISARLPNCDSIEELREKMLAKIDLITDEPRRYPNGLYGAFSRYGLLKDLSTFDGKFFNIHPKQAERMDPQIRNLLEVAFECTVDAGLHPNDLRGSKTGVVVGVASSETQDKWSQMPDEINGYEYAGCTRTMFSNRISYLLDLKGPSYSIDTASSTTLVAFHQAFAMIQDGVCDACIVCGSDLVLNPCVTLMFQCLNMLSPEGKCKAFDISGNGYVRSEGVVAVLLQKMKNAKRVYGKVMSAGSNCDGYKDEGITFPSKLQQIKLFSKVAESAGIDPSTIDFMEAHGSATKVGDPQEMNAVTEVFIKNRKKSLNTGSVKSNLGHAEPVSALSAVIKVCIAMECNIIPPNLHYNIPNPDIPALLDGRLKVITEPTPWDGGLVAVNSFGVGGANGHTLLLSNKKLKQKDLLVLPRLICISGVSKSAVEKVLNKVIDLPDDPELYSLLNNIYRKNINGHNYRGYTILNQDQDRIIQQVIKPKNLHIWFLFPGIETKWQSLESNLFNIKVFQNSIKNCEKELNNFMGNIDLIAVLKNLKNETCILNIILSITSIQVALIDTFRSLGIKPEFSIGLNIGEISCGYSDNKYTLQQTIALSFLIGKTLQRLSYRASTVKIDKNWNKCKLPLDVSLSAKISDRCSYISGPEQTILKFIHVLEERGINCEIIDSYGVNSIGIFSSVSPKPSFFDNLLKDLKNSKSLTEKNIASTVESCLKTCISTLFDTLTRPSMVHKLMNKQRNVVILKMGCGNESKDFREKKIPNIVVFDKQINDYNLVSSIGKLYVAGFQPEIQNLYPNIKFPVSHGTPMIQSMIEWDHEEKWNVVTFAPKQNRIFGEMDIEIDFDKNEFNFLLENFYNDQQVIPKSFYIVLLQRAISRFYVKSIDDISLIIENVHFIRETVIPIEKGSVKFNVNILGASGKFQILNNDSLVVCGYVRISLNHKEEQISSNSFAYKNVHHDSSLDLSKTDIYNDLNIKKYQYNKIFEQLQFFNFKAHTAKILCKNWCSFIENHFQIFILLSDLVQSKFTSVSTIRKIIINSKASIIDKVIEIKYNQKLNVFKSDGLEIHGFQTELLNLNSCKVTPALRSINFVPFSSKNLENAEVASLQLVLENCYGYNNLKVAEIVECNHNSLFSPLLLDLNPFKEINITVYSPKNTCFNEDQTLRNIRYVCNTSPDQIEDENHILIVSNVLHDSEFLGHLIDNIKTGGCILLVENKENNFIQSDQLECISSLSSNNKTFILLKKIDKKVEDKREIITITDKSIYSMSDIEHSIKQKKNDVLIVAKRLNDTGIFNLLKNILIENENKNVSLVFIEDRNVPLFFFKDKNFLQQIKKMYPVNVYKNGVWGTYLSLPLIPSISPDENSFLTDFKSNSDVSIADDIHLTLVKYQFENSSNGEHFSNDLQNFAFNENKLIRESPLIFELKSKISLELLPEYCIDKQVLSLTQEQMFISSLISNEHFLWNLPENWTFEAALSIPFSYFLSYFALFLKGNLRKTNSVLIVGMNSVAIASFYILLQYQCIPYILISNMKEKLLLKKLFPQASDSNFIVCENNCSYFKILENTTEQKMHLIFVTTPVQEHKLKSYIHLICENGKIIFTDNVATAEDIIGLSSNVRCATFHRINESSIVKKLNTVPKIETDFNDNINRKNCHSPYLIFTDRNLKWLDKFSFESVICDKEEQPYTENKRSADNIINIRRTFSTKHEKSYFNNNKVFIIIFGSLKEFELNVVSWMISQGMKNLIMIFTINRDQLQNEQLIKMYFEKWEISANKIIKLEINDFTPENVADIVHKSLTLGSVGGIFDFIQFEALQDAELSPDVKKCLDKKVRCLQNLDYLSGKLFLKLDYFVSFSFIENVKQKTYSYINEMVENIMRNRKEQNLNATLIKWGVIGECLTYIICNDPKFNDQLEPQPITSCIEALRLFLRISEPVLSSFVVRKQINTDGKTKSKVTEIIQGVAKFLGIIDINDIPANVTLLELGLDSLIGTDIQNFLEANYGIILNVQEVRDLTFETLKNLVNNNNFK